MADTSLLERIALRFSQAGDLTRRDTLHSIGRAGIALSLGALGGRYLSETADAHTTGGCAYCDSPCGCKNSIQCSQLTGANACPAGTVDCGYWEYADAACIAPGRRGYRRWTDCCGNCNDGGYCTCVLSNTAVTCCNHRTYPSTVGCNNHIKCRRWGCV